MAANRVFNIRWMTPKRARPLELDGKSDARVTYTGQQQVVKLKR